MISSNRIRLASLISLLSIQFGCTGTSPPPADVSITDSAGVVIVEVERLGAVVAPSLALETVFRTSRTGVELFGVSSARLLESDRVAVGNAENQEVLILDSSGGLERTVGRAGEGPGEFGTITTLHRSGEGGFSVYDARRGRWTHFDRSGDLLSTQPMRPTDDFRDLAPLAFGPEGDVLAIYGSVRRFPGEGIQRDTTPLLRYRTPDASPDTLSLWATRESRYERGDFGWSQTLVGFGRSLASFGTGPWAVLGDTDRLDVSLFVSTGRLVMRIRGGHDPIATTESDGEQWRRDLVSGLGEGLPPEIREMWGGAPFRESYPAFDKVAVDVVGRVWIGTTALFREDQRRWIIFGPDGTPVGTVVLPVDADVLDITENRLLTLERDDLDVEEITLYEIRGLQML